MARPKAAARSSRSRLIDVRRWPVAAARRPWLSLLLLLVSGLASPAVASAAEPEIGGFSARALDADGQPLREGYFQLELAAGDRFTGEIAVINGRKSAVRLLTYPVDGLTGGTTGTVYANRADPRRETSRWLTPQRESLSVRAGAERTLGFTVQVPADARPGDHVGAIVFEGRDAEQSGGQFSVKQVLRVAVAVQIRVTGPATKAMTIGALGLKPLGGTQIPSVLVNLQNRGALLCRPLLKVTLAFEGETVGSLERQLDTVLAGDTLPYELPWPNPLKAGTYEATAEATKCGDPARVTQSVTLEDPLGGTAQQPGTNVDPDPAATSDGGIPLWVLIVTAAVALGGGFLLARRKPREREASDDGQAPPA